MSSMEVDIPQVNGFSELPSSSPKRVQFNNEVTVHKSVEIRPKHKARRRAKLPKIDVDGEQSPPQLQKPLSPARLKKISEKDRHSRTGLRGLPKKGRCL